MTENKWIIDGHHYTCPNCKKTIAIVVNESDEDFDFCPFCGKRMSWQMANSKLEEIIDLLAVYGGFNREYLRDKLLTFANDRRSENKNKMAEIARMFGKKLGERFQVKVDNWVYDCSFEEYGFNSYGAFENPYLSLSFSTYILQELLTGTAVIIDED